MALYYVGYVPTLMEFPTHIVSDNTWMGVGVDSNLPLYGWEPHYLEHIQIQLPLEDEDALFEMQANSILNERNP